jgi:hypothetical protein
MRLRFFPRNGSHEQLCQLYRADEVGPGIEADSDVRWTFEADREFTARLARLAARIEPTDPSAQRAQLLALVVRKRSQTKKEERPPMRRLLQKKTVALAGAAALLVSATATVGAAGGVSEVAGNVQDVLAALSVTDRTPAEADIHIDAIEQPEPQGDGAGPDTGTDHADENAQHGLDTAAERGDNAGDGMQNASDQGLDNADEHALDAPGGEPPAADPEQADVELPEEANDNAAEGAGNAQDEADNGGVELPGEAAGQADAGGGNAQIPDAVPDNVDLPLP